MLNDALELSDMVKCTYLTLKTGIAFSFEFARLLDAYLFKAKRPVLITTGLFVSMSRILNPVRRQGVNYYLKYCREATSIIRSKSALLSYLTLSI